MIAHIIPIKRMPRTLGLLSYAIPDALTQTIAPGTLVRIPLRQSSIYGLVFSVEEHESVTEELKSIEDIVHTAPLLSSNHLHLIRSIADIYGISYGSSALLFTPPLQKRKLKQASWSDIVSTPTLQTTPQPNTATLYTNETERNAVLTTVAPQTLILVPEVADIVDVTAVLPDDIHTLVWHSGLSTKEQFERWFAIRSGAYDVIVGTRAALFLPFFNLNTILIYREEDPSHKHWDQKPQYFVHDLLPLWAATYAATITYLTESPRFETYYHAAKDHIAVDNDFFSTLHAPITAPTILSMQEERKAGNQSLLAERIQEVFNPTTNDIVLYINRKGYAPAVGCTNCTLVSRCERCTMAHIYYGSSNTIRCHYCGTADRLPALCPSCATPSLTPFGIGSEQVEAFVRSTYSHLPHHIIRIDSSIETIPPLPDDAPIILIGTDKMVPFIRWDRTDLFTMIDLDTQLLYPDFRAVEAVWHTIRHIATHKTSATDWYIQTRHPDHLLFRSLKEPERLYRTDLGARQALNLPPYSKLVRLSIGKPTEFGAKTEAERVHLLLSRTLTEHGISARLRPPYPTSPTFYRGRNWYTILVTLTIDSWEEDIKKIIALLPGNWRVDISPQSLLAP